MRALALLATLALASAADAAPLRVVVRHAGGDELVIGRLEGQIVDLDVEEVPAEGALEPSLDQQIAAAEAMAARDDAGAVVWFRGERGAIVLVVATPGVRGVLVRKFDAGDASATAEAAAEAARAALRAIAAGGTIGVAVAAPDARAPWRWGGAIGWDVAGDRGADAGAHAIRMRLDGSRGVWASSLALGLGPPLRKAGEVAIDLSRSTITAGLAWRRGAWQVALAAGVALYHRATAAVPSGLVATGSQLEAAALVGPEVRWVLRAGPRWGLELAAGLDVVLGAPTFAVDRGGGTVENLATIGTFQPHGGVAIVVGP